MDEMGDNKENYITEEEANEYFNGIEDVFEKIVRKIICEFQKPWSNKFKIKP